MHICLPSPACVGDIVGRKQVDLNGDNVVGQALAGDGWRIRHNNVKEKILSLLKWAGLQVTCELFKLFAGLIPQEGLSRMERGRKRQGMVRMLSECCHWKGAGVGTVKQFRGSGCHNFFR